MRVLAILCFILAGIGLAVIPLALGVQVGLSGRAQLIQRVEVSEAASLFGDAGTMIGSPQKMIIEDKAAFLPGEGPEGARLVSENYLKEKGIYPLQLQTVEYLSQGVMLAGGASAFVFGLAGWLARRRLARKSARA